jgi:HSP20 family molecular chaperone IbpA
MSRRVRLSGANLKEIKARLEDGVLTVTIPKEVKQDTVRKIAIE